MYFYLTSVLFQAEGEGEEIMGMHRYNIGEGEGQDKHDYFYLTSVLFQAEGEGEEMMGMHMYDDDEEEDEGEVQPGEDYTNEKALGELTPEQKECTQIMTTFTFMTVGVVNIKSMLITS